MPHSVIRIVSIGLAVVALIIMIVGLIAKSKKDALVPKITDAGVTQAKIDEVNKSNLDLIKTRKSGKTKFWIGTIGVVVFGALAAFSHSKISKVSGESSKYYNF